MSRRTSSGENTTDDAGASDVYLDPLLSRPFAAPSTSKAGARKRPPPAPEHYELPQQKIPRPPNAFMLFANEWRKKLAMQFPRESNKEISIKLGHMWKSMAKESKDRYFNLAREVDAEHKRKYPDYVYNPKEARIRKAMREQAARERNHLPRSHLPPGAPALSLPKVSPQWKPFTSRQQQKQGMLSPRMLAEQRQMEDTKAAIREQVEHGMLYEPYMDGGMLPYPMAGPMGFGGHSGTGDFSLLADIDNHPHWYPYLQAPTPGPSYMSHPMMRRPEMNKMPVPNWPPQYPDIGRMRNSPQASPYPIRHPMPNQYPNSLGMQPQGQDPSMMAQSHQFAMFPSPGVARVESTPMPATTIKDERTDEADLLDLVTSNSSEPSNIPSTVPNSLSTSMNGMQTQMMSALGSENSGHSSSQSNVQDCLSVPTASMTSNAHTNNTSTTPSTSSSSETTNSNTLPLPAFQQAFGSTEIGRFAHEGFFNQLLDKKKSDTSSQQQSYNQSHMSATLTFSSPKTTNFGDNNYPPTWSHMYYFSPGGKGNGPPTYPCFGSPLSYQSWQKGLSPYLANTSSPSVPMSLGSHYPLTLIECPNLPLGEQDTILVGLPGLDIEEGHDAENVLTLNGQVILTSDGQTGDDVGIDLINLHSADESRQSEQEENILLEENHEDDSQVDVGSMLQDTSTIATTTIIKISSEVNEEEEELLSL